MRRAELKSRVILAEATATAAEARAGAAEWMREAAEARVAAVTDDVAEHRRIRAEATEEATRIIGDARIQAEYIVAQARVVADAESAATLARAELQAERLQVTAAAAMEQTRTEDRAERERAKAEMADERTRLRDQALLEAARMRDEARSAAATELAAAERERDRILADAHAEAFAIVEQARADAASQSVDTAIAALTEAGSDDASEPGEATPSPGGAAWPDDVHGDVPADFWNAVDGGTLEPPQPLLAIDDLVVDPTAPGSDAQAPFERTPLAVDNRVPKPDPAIVDLSTFWEQEARRPEDERRKRFRRRSRR